MEKFAEPRFAQFYSQQISIFHWNLKGGLILASLLCLTIAIARPQWDREMQMVSRSGLDIVVCIDVSKSMDATDIQPSRLERAKDQISLFVDQLKGDRIAIVPFAGSAFVQCPLTDDYGAVKLFLSNLDTNTVPVWGTDISAALTKAASVFPANTKNKVVVLISDGEDLEGNVVSQARKMGEKKITIYTLGVGSPEGSSIPMKDNNGNTQYARDASGAIVLSKLDSRTLDAIATSTGGKFYLVTPQQSEIFAIMKSIENLEKNKYSSKYYDRFKDQYTWFAGFALFLFIISILITYKRKNEMKRFLS
ncbi:MAG TPA: VWA domain-containing protein [Candidatus Cloacimonadota bacterium]|nr:VWA domain-containing protein [Candidatus Cloacimonadota bacterium]HPT71508.1 VWA domain-containing protein [Candidatus Cloacimonadota bacterium]